MIPIIFGLAVILAGYITAYLVSLYSLAVFIDPDEVESLFPKASREQHEQLERLVRDPRAFRHIAIVFNSFALVVITIAALVIQQVIWPVTFLGLTGMYALTLAVIWTLYVVIVEFLPRRKSRKAINRAMLRHLWLIGTVYQIFFPVVRLLRSGLLRSQSDEPVTEEEKDEIVERAIEALADEAGIGEPIVEQDEKEMIGQIFQLDQTIVREIMIPRMDIVGIEKGMSFADIRKLVEQDGHSRYPVFDGSIDKIVGMVYVKDLFNNLPEPGEPFVMGKLLRKPYFVPESKVIGELMQEFKRRRLHIAIAVDEYGGVAGVVTLEDIIEEIFGEIRDEHDEEADEITKLTNGEYIVNASLMVEKLQDALDTEYEQEEYDTVGGLIYDLVGSVPVEGQQIRWNDIEFVIEKIEGQRIRSVRVRA